MPHIFPEENENLHPLLTRNWSLGTKSQVRELTDSNESEKRKTQLHLYQVRSDCRTGCHLLRSLPEPTKLLRYKIDC